METKSVRVSGMQSPAYLNGRSREMLIAALRPSATPVAGAADNFASTMRNLGVRPGDGVPFAALYMTRAKKKLAVLPQAA